MMAANFESMKFRELQVEAKELGLRVKGLNKADLLSSILAAGEVAKEKGRVRDAKEVAELATLLRARELAEEQEDFEVQQQTLREKTRARELAEDQERFSNEFEVRDEARRKKTKVKKTNKGVSAEQQADRLSDGDNPTKIARRSVMAWGDLVGSEVEAWDDLETRFFSTMDWIQYPDHGEPSLEERGFEVTAKVEPGDFVAVLRSKPNEPLTWTELQRKLLDFYRVQRVTSGGVQVVFVRTVGKAGADDDRTVDTTPIVIPGSGEVLRATGGVLMNLRQELGTKAAAEDGTGHKNTFFDAITGTSLKYTDKTNVAARVSASRVMRRLSTEPVLTSLMDDTLHFDAKKAWEKLAREATIRQERQRTGVRTEQHLAVHKWSTIQRLPVATRGHEYFLRIADGNWGGSPEVNSEISLNWFTDVPLSSTNNNANKMAIASALENVGRFFIFCHGGTWDTFLLPFVSRIREGDWSEDIWESSFLRCELEGVFRLFFHTLHGTSTTHCYSEYGGNLATPVTVGMWLEQLLSDLEPTDPRQNKFLRQRVSTKPQTTSVLAKPTGARSSSTLAPSKPVAEDRFCRYHFLHALGVNNVSGVPYDACREVSCRYRHVDVSKLDKRKIAEMAGKIIAIPVFGAKVKSQLERTIAARV